MLTIVRPTARGASRLGFVVAILAAVFMWMVMTGTVSATHDCPTEPGVDDAQHCSELTTEAIDLTLAAAQQAFDDCAAFYAATPFLIPVICTPQHIEDINDANSHTGDVYPVIFAEVVAAHLALPSHHGPANKAEKLIDSGVPGKGLSDAPGLKKQFNEKSKAGERAGKK